VTRVLFDFTRPEAARAWHGLHDGVMGGLSDGAMRTAGACAAFEGVLSLANGGGFASVRAEIDPSATAGSAGVRVRVRGDGRAYSFVVKEDPASGDGLWRAPIGAPRGAWAEVEIPWAAFVKSVHGRPVESPPPRAGRIGQVGLMIAKEGAGPFRLEVATVSLV
jgi:monofunctional biosynthetic peptidoglycan transglycosylase